MPKSNREIPSPLVLWISLTFFWFDLLSGLLLCTFRFTLFKAARCLSELLRSHVAGPDLVLSTYPYSQLGLSSIFQCTKRAPILSLSVFTGFKHRKNEFDLFIWGIYAFFQRHLRFLSAPQLCMLGGCSMWPSVRKSFCLVAGTLYSVYSGYGGIQASLTWFCEKFMNSDLFLLLCSQMRFRRDAQVCSWGLFLNRYISQ